MWPPICSLSISTSLSIKFFPTSVFGVGLRHFLIIACFYLSVLYHYFPFASTCIKLPLQTYGLCFPPNSSVLLYNLVLVPPNILDFFTRSIPPPFFRTFICHFQVVFSPSLLYSILTYGLTFHEDPSNPLLCICSNYSCFLCKHTGFLFCGSYQPFLVCL